ncbi:MAG: DUF4097 family beta strand repeat-containing protein [Vicinamibacterales bacterium]
MRAPRLTRWTVAAAAALLLLPAVATAQGRETETVDRTVPFPSNGTLELKNFSGRVRITGTSGNEVVIHAVRRARREQLDRIKLTIDTSGSVVHINANDRQERPRNDRDNVVETEFEIRLPASARLDVNAFSSDVTVTGVTGRQVLQTFSGEITVEGASGPLDVETFSGGLDVDLRGAGAAPEIDAETFSGDIRLRLADNASGRVDFDSFSGSFESELPITLRSSSRRRVSGALPGGEGGRTVKVHTFSGSVRIVK